MITDPEDPFYVSMTDPFRPIAKKFYDTWGNMELAQYAANKDGEDAAEARRRLSDRDGYGLIFKAGEAWREWEGHVIGEIEDLRTENRELRREQEELRRAHEWDGVTDLHTVAEMLTEELKRLTADDEPTAQPTNTEPTESTTNPATTEPTESTSDPATTEPTSTESAPPWLITWD